MKENFIKLRAIIIITALAVWLSNCGTGGNKADDAEEQTLKGYTDSWLFINYWALWCKPCRVEIPELNQFAEHNQGKVTVIAVNFDGVTGEELRKQVQQLNIQFTVVTKDPASLLEYSRPQVLPTTYVLAPGGALHKILLGPQTQASLREAIKTTHQQETQ